MSPSSTGPYGGRSALWWHTSEHPTARHFRRLRLMTGDELREALNAASDRGNVAAASSYFDECERRLTWAIEKMKRGGE